MVLVPTGRSDLAVLTHGQVDKAITASFFMLLMFLSVKCMFLKHSTSCRPPEPGLVLFMLIWMPFASNFSSRTTKN